MIIHYLGNHERLLQFAGAENWLIPDGQEVLAFFLEVLCFGESPLQVVKGEDTTRIVGQSHPGDAVSLGTHQLDRSLLEKRTDRRLPVKLRMVQVPICQDV